MQEELRRDGGFPKQEVVPPTRDEKLASAIDGAFSAQVSDALRTKGGKLAKARAYDAVKKACVAEFAPDALLHPEKVPVVKG